MGKSNTKRNLNMYWDSDPPPVKAIVDMCDDFDARGMRRVYGRGERWGNGPTFNLDIWRNKEGCLFMRCWSRCGDFDNYSFEIKGVNVGSIPERQSNEAFSDVWIPKQVRRAYEDWVMSPWF